MTKDKIQNQTNNLPTLSEDSAGFVLLNVFDLFLTVYIFHHGGREINPVGVSVLDHYGLAGFILFKFTMVAFVVLVLDLLYKLRPVRAKRLMHGANLVYFGVVLWECVLLLFR